MTLNSAELPSDLKAKSFLSATLESRLQRDEVFTLPELPKTKIGVHSGPEESNNPETTEQPQVTNHGGPILLSDGRFIPSDTKVMVEDQNEWYRLFSQSLHGLKKDMPLKNVKWPPNQ